MRSRCGRRGLDVDVGTSVAMRSHVFVPAAAFPLPTALPLPTSSRPPANPPPIPASSDISNTSSGNGTDDNGDLATPRARLGCCE